MNSSELNALTIAELYALAKQHGIPSFRKYKKAQLIELLQAPAPAPKKKATRIYAEALSAIGVEKDKLAKAKKIPHDEYEEISFILDTLGYALEDGDENLFAVAFVAFRYISACHKKIGFAPEAVEEAVAKVKKA